MAKLSDLFTYNSNGLGDVREQVKEDIKDSINATLEKKFISEEEKEIMILMKEMLGDSMMEYVNAKTN